MSTTRTAAQAAVPPPRQAFEQLYDGTGPVGWIRDGRLAFAGFATVGEAAKAAWVAHVALERRLAKSRGEPAPHIEPDLELWVSGADEWLKAEGRLVARLLSPASALPGGDSWFGFELVFSPDTSSFEIESNAHVVYRGLRRSGVRWPMRAIPRGPERRHFRHHSSSSHEAA